MSGTTRKQSEHDAERMASYQHVVRQMAEAFTRAEVDDALARMREHIARWPEDAGTEWDHSFARRIEWLEEREREASTLRLSSIEITERETLLKSTRDLGDTINNPEDHERLTANLLLLRDWLSRFPTDPSVCARLESIANELELAALVEQVSPRANNLSAPEPVLASR